MVLTGAGLSTDSGIPDYRGPGSPPRQPMTYQEFVLRAGGPAALLGAGARRLRPVLRRRRPTPATGRWPALDPDLLITQNVDGLHEEAGSRRLVALHGRIADVVCLDCRRHLARAAALEQRLADLNPGWADAHADLVLRPDGDVELTTPRGFVVPAARRAAAC